MWLLVTDAADGTLVEAKQKATEATVKIIAPKVGGVTLKGGKHLAADEMIAGPPSVMFDAVALVVPASGAKALLGEKPALDFVSDAFAHCKAIDHTAEAMPRMQKAGVMVGDFVLDLPANGAALIDLLPARNWDREAKVKAPI